VTRVQREIDGKAVMKTICFLKCNYNFTQWCSP